ncbi:MAG: adenylate/guanylate cyclase domain-containing protein, partial [Fimbriimonadaceae bacterium]|nr:adenylate/guanylate cyclase domain-containing protein [Fimbriimonadaceae bacterium]
VFLLTMSLLQIFVFRWQFGSFAITVLMGIVTLSHAIISLISRSLRLATIAASTLSLAFLGSILAGRNSSLPLGFAIAALFWLFMFLMVLNCSAAILAAFVDIRRQKYREKKMTRHDRIARLLDLRERREMAQLTQEGQGKSFKQWLHENPFWVALIAGIVPSLIMVFLTRKYDPDGTFVTQPSSTVADPDLARYFLAAALIGVIQQLTMAIAGYAAKTWGRFLISLAMITMLNIAIVASPFNPTQKVMSDPNVLTGWVLGFLMNALAMLMGCLAVQVQSWAERNQLLHRNDPNVLAEEINALEQYINNQREVRCVMVVDVAGSTQMKANADPLVCEWTFREYQNCLARESIALGGSVVSTAGDGAVISFDSPEDCFRAAQRILASVQHFNETTNRLPMPFRLRIGMHQGVITGSVSEVQFTEIIDIAAHIEQITPIGEIGMSEALAGSLPEHWARPSNEVSDGRAVFLAQAEGIA